MPARARPARRPLIACLVFAAVLPWAFDIRGDRAAAARPAPQSAVAASPAEVTSPARRVDRTRLLADVTALASPRFEGRGTGTPGAARARAWIANELAAAGVPPGGSSGFEQPFTISNRDVRAILPGGRPFRTAFTAANVVGRVAGRVAGARAIVVTAHYDHLGTRDGVIYPGADDNASGVAVLLAAARHFVRHPPRRPIVFAALDGEEAGFHGARTLVASDLLPPGGVALNVNLDMVSRSGANEIYAAGTYHSPWLAPILRDVQERSTVAIRFGHDRPREIGGGLEDWTRSSDHAAFHQAKVPFVYFGVEDHPDYHRPTDTADRIDPRFFGDAADMILEAIATFDAQLE